MDSNRVSTSFSINKIPVIQEQKFTQGFSKRNFQHPSTFPGMYWDFRWNSDGREAGPNAGFEFGQQYEFIKSLKHHKCQKYCRQIGLLCSVYI